MAWNVEDVVDWARKFLNFDEEDQAVLRKNEFTVHRLLLVPNLEWLESHGLAGGPALDLWAEIERMKKLAA